MLSVTSQVPTHVIMEMGEWDSEEVMWRYIEGRTVLAKQRLNTSELIFGNGVGGMAAVGGSAGESGGSVHAGVLAAVEQVTRELTDAAGRLEAASGTTSLSVETSVEAVGVETSVEAVGAAAAVVETSTAMLGPVRWSHGVEEEVALSNKMRSRDNENRPCCDQYTTNQIPAHTVTVTSLADDVRALLEDLTTKPRKCQHQLCTQKMMHCKRKEITNYRNVNVKQPSGSSSRSHRSGYSTRGSSSIVGVEIAAIGYRSSCSSDVRFAAKPKLICTGTKGSKDLSANPLNERQREGLGGGNLVAGSRQPGHGEGSGLGSRMATGGCEQRVGIEARCGSERDVEARRWGRVVWAQGERDGIVMGSRFGAAERVVVAQCWGRVAWVRGE